MLYITMRSNRIDEIQVVRVLDILHRDKSEKFSSHDFIEVYSAEYEDDYIDWLCEYRGTNKAFQTVHSQIARYLSKNARDLQIHKIGNYESETVHGTNGMPMWFAWGAE